MRLFKRGKSVLLLNDKARFPAPEIRYRFLGFNLDRHWSLARDDFCENFKNDLLWLIVLRAVKVRDALKNWGYINSDRCAFVLSKGNNPPLFP